MEKSEKEKTILMRAYKFDGRLHYEQPLKLVQRNENHIVLKGEKGRKLKHHTRGKVFEFDRETREYFFSDRWYTAALVYDEDGHIEQVYCNIAKPGVISGESVDFVDLDVDVIVRDGQIKIIDIDEFDENKVLYRYGRKIEKKVMETAEEVVSHIKRGVYPFDKEILGKGTDTAI